MNFRYVACGTPHVHLLAFNPDAFVQGADEDRLKSKITNNNYKAAFRTK